MIELPSQVNIALSALSSAGFEAYIVGGCVRDSLLSSVPTDYDITTSAMPEQVKEVFIKERTVDTGIKHGTVTVIIYGMPIEITTYRTEAAYSDNRHPDSVTFTSFLEDDLSRRDFTMNALAFNPKSGLVDCFGGREDVYKRIIRCVGDPDSRFREDALRILRALRFAATLGFEIEEKTKAAAFNNKELLKNISSERIFCELEKLLLGKNVRRVLMDYVDIIGVVIPELLELKGFDQRNPYHIYDILEHTAVVAENTPKERIIRLAALLHDIGKPRCFTVDNRGIGHFYGHSEKGVSIARGILNRLKVDNDTKNQVLTLIKWHDYRIMPTDRGVKKVLRRITPELFFKLLDLKRADNKGQNIARYNHQHELRLLESIAQKVIDEGQCFLLSDLAVDGRDLITFGIPEGRQIGETLNMLLNAVINGRVENNKDELLKYIQRTKRNG